MPEFVTVDGNRATFRLTGEGFSPVIALPGGPLRSARYLGDLGGLASQHPLAILDLRPQRVDALVADVDALREHLGVDRLDLLAHSAGASLAIQYAAAYPQRLRRLVLITPSARAVGIQPEPRDVQAAIERRRDEPWYQSARAAFDAQQAGDQSPDTQLAAARLFYGRWDAAAHQHALFDERPPDAVAVYYPDGALNPERTRAALAAVNASVLIVTGELDLWPSEAMGRALAALFPHAELVTQLRAGHYPWIDDPIAFANSVAGFLNQ